MPPASTVNRRRHPGLARPRGGGRPLWRTAGRPARAARRRAHRRRSATSSCRRRLPRRSGSSVTPNTAGTATHRPGRAPRRLRRGGSGRRAVAQIVLTATSTAWGGRPPISPASILSEAPLPDGELTDRPLTAQDYATATAAVPRRCLDGPSVRAGGAADGRPASTRRSPRPRAEPRAPRGHRRPAAHMLKTSPAKGGHPSLQPARQAGQRAVHRPAGHGDGADRCPAGWRSRPWSPARAPSRGGQLAPAGQGPGHRGAEQGEVAEAAGVVPGDEQPACGRPGHPGGGT